MRDRPTRVAPAAAVALLVLGACGGHKGKVNGPGGDAGPPPLTQRVDLAWASEPVSRTDPDHAQIYLVITDETGKSTSVPVATAAGTCARVAPVKPDLLTYQCKAGDGSAVRFHGILQVTDLVVIKELIDAGDSSDPMNGAELTRVPLPPGAKVEAVE
jgi:hypothetical protein